MSEPAQLPSPQNTDAEEAVLGAMLISRKAIDRVSDLLEPTDFYRESHGLIFHTIVELARRQEVDAILLVDELGRRGWLDRIGGRARIHGLVALLPTVSNVAHYARIIKDTKAQRELIKAGGEIAQLAWRGGPVADAKATAERILSQAVVDHTEATIAPLRAELEELVTEIREVVAGAPPMKGLDSGFHQLDQLTNGFHPGQLIVVAARPSMGKSVLVQNIAENVAEAGGTAVIFSLEMRRREMQLRALARHGEIPLDRLRTGELIQEDLPKMSGAVQAVKRWELYVETDSLVTPGEIRLRCRRLQKAKGLDLLVVDYLQLMSLGQQIENRNQEISMITRSFKSIADDLEVPVIVVSQLSRAVDARPRTARRPTLGDLRDSGAIEQDADVVIFVYRDDYYDTMEHKSDSPGVAELNVAKNRMGSSDTVKLAFIGRYQTFKQIGSPT